MAHKSAHAAGSTPPQPREPSGSGGGGRAPRDTRAAQDGQPTQGTPAPKPAPTVSPWHQLRRAIAPRGTRSQWLAAVLCGVVGFALVVQLTQNQTNTLSSLRQSDLVRLLDEVTRHRDALADEQAALEQKVAELESGSQNSQAAIEAAEQAAQTQGILAGRLPATGPGIWVTVKDPDRGVHASALVNLMEELRNAGAEVMQVNDQRITTSSAFVDTEDGMTVNGADIVAPYVWRVIGDSTTLRPALEIPGGALAVLRNAGGTVDVTDAATLDIDATRTLPTPEVAVAVPADG